MEIKGVQALNLVDKVVEFEALRQVRLLEVENPASAIIFCNTKVNVHFVSVVLQRFGYDADELSADLPQNERERVLERVRQAVEALEIPHATGTLRLTVSAGLALHLPGDTVVHTLERADQALYTAKALGRNRWVVAPSGPQHPLRPAAGPPPFNARV